WGCGAPAGTAGEAEETTAPPEQSGGAVLFGVYVPTVLRVSSRVPALPGTDGADVEHRDAALVDLRDRLAQRGGEILRIFDRPLRPRAEPAAQGCEVNLRLEHRGADPSVLERALAMARHLALMLLVVHERTVVVDNREQRNLVVHRGPQRPGRHHHVAVAENHDREAALLVSRQRRADRRAGAVADAAADVGAQVRAHALEVPHPF